MFIRAEKFTYLSCNDAELTECSEYASENTTGTGNVFKMLLC